MRCNCESSYCQLHPSAQCANTATVECEWVGGVCAPCAVIMQSTGGAAFIGHSLADLHDSTAGLAWRITVEASMNDYGIATRDENGQILPDAVTTWQTAQVAP